MKALLTFLSVIVIAVICRPASAQIVTVGNVEELYAAVNDPANAGSTLTLAPGIYMLSAADPSGAARPNGGRLDLLENMSLMGVEDDRSAVVIDAINLPTTSLTLATPVAAVRTGRGHNSVEWLTVQNARRGAANLDSTLEWPGTACVRIAHVALTGARRGLDIRNAGPLGANGETIEADIVDNEFFRNNFGDPSPNMGIRILNLQTDTRGAVINVRMTGNRSWGQQQGSVIANNASLNSTINVFSAGNLFYDNAAGTVILGGYVDGGTFVSNGNTVNFEAHGDRFVDNTRSANTFFGGLVVFGGIDLISTPDNVNNNTVNISLWGCRMEGNNTWDLLGVGAKAASAPAPGVNNHVTIEIHGEGRGHGWQPVEFFADSLPNDPSLNNSITVIR